VGRQAVARAQGYRQRGGRFFLQRVVKVGGECVEVPVRISKTELGGPIMDSVQERRREQRLRYHWPVWYAEDSSERVFQGQMVDVSSEGAAFTCYSHEGYPYPSQKITARFSVPRFGSEESFDMANFTRSANICRVDDVNPFLRRIAVCFSDALPFKPGEQARDELDQQERLRAVKI